MKKVVEPCPSSHPCVVPSVLLEPEPSQCVRPAPCTGRNPRSASAAHDDHRRSQLRGESVVSPGTSSCWGRSLSCAASCCHRCGCSCGCCCCGGSGSCGPCSSR